MTKKQDAINRACTAFEKLCKYKGITCDVDTDLYIRPGATIKEIESIAANYLECCNIPLQPATEKQINYLLILSKYYKEENKRIKRKQIK